MTDSVTFKNRKTGKSETITQKDLEMVDWGFHFFVSSESEAYRAAYEYRNCPHGCVVEFAGGVKRWMVTVFNKSAVETGLDGAK